MLIIRDINEAMGISAIINVMVRFDINELAEMMRIAGYDDKANTIYDIVSTELHINEDDNTASLRVVFNYMDDESNTGTFYIAKRNGVMRGDFQTA